MTTNPFLVVKTSAGIFAATVGQPDLAERICAGVCQAVQSDASRILDFKWWIECVNNIPKLVDSKVEESKFNGTSLSKVLSTVSSVPELSNKIADAALALSGLTNLNCFVIEPSREGMQIILAKLSVDMTKPGVGSGTLGTQRYIVPSANPDVAKGLKEVFGDIPPLSNEPYYVSS
jgi:hypothetical protein